MATRAIDKSTAETALIGIGILAFWPAYFLGALYVLGSVIGWLVLGIVLLRRFVEGNSIPSAIGSTSGLQTPAYRQTPYLVVLWIIAMAAMLVALWVGHAQWSLGTGKTIKSSIGWAKGWALIALFIYLGATLRLQIDTLVRAVCITSSIAMPFFVLSILVYAIGGPQSLFVSPLKAVGGPGPEFFEFRFFGLNPETGMPRWFFFTPWAPAAGLVGCLFCIICSQEKTLGWRLAGMSGAALIVLASQSRAGMLILILFIPALFTYRALGFGRTVLCLALLVPVVALLAMPLIDMLLGIAQDIRDSRPDSTRVRAALADIAIQRWQSEAPIWGHGIVERGPKIVEHMPIGTHHSWYGLLFTKGIVGAIALAIPLIMSLLYLLLEASRNARGFIGLSIVIVLGLYSFFENLEILVYLYWPALILVGYALQPAVENSQLKKSNKPATTSGLQNRSGIAVAI